MEEKAMDLFKAYSEGKLPLEGGYIVTSFFQDDSAYAKYEVLAYSGAKNVYLGEQGLVFQTDANKLFVLAEPAAYEHKELEPISRDGQHQIPHSFSELEQITAGNLTRILFSRQPVIVYFSFTIGKPTTLSSSMLFYNLPDAPASVSTYLQESLSTRAGVPAGDAAAAAGLIVDGLKRFPIGPELAAKAAFPKAQVAAPQPAAIAPAPVAAPPLVAPPKPVVVPKKAPAKKPAVKKAVAKKVAAKKPAAKKAPPKKAAAKKPPAKKPAAKKGAAKKPALKKPAPKKVPAKKPKPAAKKPAAKKPAAKRPTAKKASPKKAAGKKPAAKKAAAKKPAAKKAPAKKKR